MKMSKIIKSKEIKKNQFFALNIHSELFAVPEEDLLENPVFIPMAIMPHTEETPRETVEAAIEAAQLAQEQIAVLEETYSLRVQESYAEGYEAGTAIAKTDFANASQVLLRLVDDIEKAKKVLFRQDGEIFWRVIASVCENILKKTIAEHPAILIETIKSAYLSLATEGSIVARLNPLDLDLLISLEEAAPITNLPHLTFKADASIAQGGCIVESDLGAIDAQIEAQLKEIERAIGGIDFLAATEGAK